jgi:hypothetical protein
MTVASVSAHSARPTGASTTVEVLGQEEHDRPELPRDGRGVLRQHGDGRLAQVVDVVPPRVEARRGALEEGDDVPGQLPGRGHGAAGLR